MIRILSYFIICFIISILFQISGYSNIKLKKILSVSNTPIEALSMSSDGLYLAIGTLDGIIQVLDIKTGVLEKIGQHDQKVTAIKWYPNKKIIVSTSIDTTVKIWDLKKSSVKVMREHLGPVFSLDIDPQEKWIATAGSGNRIILWDPKENQIISKKIYKEAIWSLKFSPNGKYIACGGGEGDPRVILWNYNTDQLISMNKHKKGINSLSFSPQGKYLASASVDHKILIWDLSTKKTKSLILKKKEIWKIKYYNVNNLLINYLDKYIYKLNIKKNIYSVQYKHFAQITSFTCTKNKSPIILGDSLGNIIILDKQVIKPHNQKSLANHEIAIQLLSPYRTIKLNQPIKLNLLIKSKYYIKKIIIFIINEDTRVFTYKPVENVNTVEILKYIQFTKGKNHIFIMVTDQSGMDTRRYLFNIQ